MGDIAVQFDHVGKLYKLGLVGTGTLSHDLNRWWKTAVLHKEDPYLKIGETNDRSKRGTTDYVWALKDITFDVRQGDVVGIIGKNGAGKSTLLKLLSRVTSPTTGTIRARGRIASLLEVGTGFHPEMTGRENIYMNGSIMGMTRHEITRKLDEIVDFAGVERYVDTPVKRYSSGMTVRLGFAVAAFLEPEILVVDEVLAVGDAEFQKKAIGKMQDVSRGEGRTVLFVSHNMAAVRSLCTSGIVLENGMITYKGTAEDSIQFYLNKDSNSVKDKIIDNIDWVSPYLKINKLAVNRSESAISTISSDQTELHISISGICTANLKFNMVLTIKNKDGVPLASYDPANSFGELMTVSEGNFSIEKDIRLPQNLTKGMLKVGIFLHHPRVSFYLMAQDCCVLESVGHQEQFGYVLDQKNNGFFGLSEVVSENCQCSN